MKKISFTLFIVVVIIVVCFFLKKSQPQWQPNSMAVKQPSPLGENQRKQIVVNTSASIPTTLPVEKVANNRPILNVTATQNIGEWKAVLDVKKINMGGITNENFWVVEQNYTNPVGIPFIIGDTNNNWIQFNSNLISIRSKNADGQIQSIEMQSVMMNIADLRVLGDSLLHLMNQDKTEFDAWCDKVGNQWLDAPLFASQGSRVPNNNKYYGFGVHRTFSDKKPWYINFTISEH